MKNILIISSKKYTKLKSFTDLIKLIESKKFNYLTSHVEDVETYKDFPKTGIEFKDVLGIIQEPKIFKELILKMSSSQIIKDAEAIISIDARGFIFGSAISFQASKPMIVARKPGKLPGELIK